MNIVEINKDGLQDVVSCMRLVADEIQAGTYGKVNSAVTVIVTQDDDEVEVFGWGRASSLEISGILSAGQLKILDIMFPN